MKIEMKKVKYTVAKECRNCGVEISGVYKKYGLCPACLSWERQEFKREESELHDDEEER